MRLTALYRSAKAVKQILVVLQDIHKGQDVRDETSWSVEERLEKVAESIARVAHVTYRM